VDEELMMEMAEKSQPSQQLMPTVLVQLAAVVLASVATAVEGAVAVVAAARGAVAHPVLVMGMEMV